MLEEKKYSHENLTLNYYEKGSGPTLILIHGAGIRALTYKKTLLKLSEKYHVIAPDLPGFGKSDAPPATWSFEHYAEYLNKFLDTKSLEDITIIGHSLGGRIAMGMSSKSKRITRLILIDSSPLASYYYGSRYNLSKLLFNTFIEITREGSMDYAKVALDNLFNIKKHRLSLLRTKRIIDTSLKIDNKEARAISIPTLILWGENDRIIKPEMAYKLQKEIKNSQVKIIKNANHGWCFTKPEVLLSEINHFINNKS